MGEGIEGKWWTLAGTTQPHTIVCSTGANQTFTEGLGGTKIDTTVLGTQPNTIPSTEELLAFDPLDEEFKKLEAEVAERYRRCSHTHRVNNVCQGCNRIVEYIFRDIYE